MYVVKRKGTQETFTTAKIKQSILNAVNLSPKLTTVDVDKLVELSNNGVAQGMNTSDMFSYLAESAASMGTLSYEYGILAGRLDCFELHKSTPGSFTEAMNTLGGILCDTFLKKVREYNYDVHINHARDFEYDIIGLRTLKRSYLLKYKNKIVERPQYMLMRVAVFLSDAPEDAIEMYNILSEGWYTHASPTLFNSGMKHHQLASCFLMSMKEDSIAGIYDTLKEVALISKSAGGIGIDVSNIRSKGAFIKGTNGTSNGLVPMLRVFNNTARYCDQCVVPETILYTVDGPTEIGQLSNGDLIIHENQCEAIDNVLEHPYDGPILKIHTMHSIEPLTITPEHPIFALKDLGKGYNYTLIKNRLNTGQVHAEWLDAKDLSSRDFICFPIPNYEKDDLKLSADDCYFYGILLGDGTLMKNKTYGTITIHSQNKAFVKDWLVNYFENKCIQYDVQSEDLTTKVRWNKSVHMPIKYGDVYKNKEKYVNTKFLHLPLHKAKQIVKGLLDTDGSNGKELMFDNTSRKLIEAMRYLCLRMGVLTSGYIRDRVGETHMTKRGPITNKKISYVLRIPKVETISNLMGIEAGQFFKFFEHNNVLYTRIKSIEEHTYSGTLYDLQMVEDHSYITHNGLVHNGGGKRKGSFAIYIEPWHKDIQDVLKLKLNHGNEEDRARDLFYALWIPDLFMKRVASDAEWSLFCPTEAPKLQDSYGEEFERLYEQYEATVSTKTTIKARDLWMQVCTTQIETGTPYLLYKDACNLKSNQKNLGTIRSSNLCCEIVEYHDKDETAVCTLASIALPKYVTQHGFNFDRLVEMAGIVTKKLNAVIDKTSYPIVGAKISNQKHRPIGIGVQGLSDVFQMMGYAYDSEEAMVLDREIFEAIYYGSVKASIELAKKHGPYDSFKGSPACEGKFQFDLWGIPPTKRFDWSKLRNDMVNHGLRNSLLTAPMPTASSAQILGNTESFEPRTSNIYVRRVLSGEFVIVNKYLQQTCMKNGMWTTEVINTIIKDKGSIQNTTLPDDIKKIFKTTWELSQKSLIDHAAVRGPYIDQSQSLNLYLPTPTHSQLTSMHFYAWKKGLKTGQYYLRTRPKADAIAFTVECESCSA